MTSRAGPRPILALVTLAWIGFTLFFAITPRMPEPPYISSGQASDLGHYVTHFILTMLVYLVIVGAGPSGLLKRTLALVAAIGFSLALGVSIEGMQHLTYDRAAELSDVIVNSIGTATGVAAVMTLELLNINRRFLSLAVAGMVVFVMALVSGNALF